MVDRKNVKDLVVNKERKMERGRKTSKLKRLNPKAVWLFHMSNAYRKV